MYFAANDAAAPHAPDVPPGLVKNPRFWRTGSSADRCQVAGIRRQPRRRRIDDAVDQVQAQLRANVQKSIAGILSSPVQDAEALQLSVARQT